ncbi:MAG: RsmB/NOP family class I SAM-dependent RNA methyltransferase [Lachnospiraceae bacterium]|nr:RsmB/NOP family class I SAM-dependent RNA methyltransferase [Lachnospiraceae bacterium]
MIPTAFLDRMKAMLGAEYEDFLASLDGPQYRALRVNTTKISVEQFLAKVPFQVQPVPWTDNGFYYDESQRPGKSSLHEAGVYYIQEPSAMAPVMFLEPQPGERILDLCAAPGGKSTQIGAKMNGQGILVCNEIHPARAKILSENIERMGIAHAIVTNETPERLAQMFGGYFDKVLVDAPCSGEGMFRKEDAAGQEWSLDNVRLCADRQDEVLDQAAKMLRIGGRMVYSTCTFAPLEDEGAVARFLERHPDFEIVKVKIPEGFTPGRGDWAVSFGGVTKAPEEIDCTMRLMPHRLKGEGHYLAVLKRKGDEEGNARSKVSMEKSLSCKDVKEYVEFAKETFTDERLYGEGVFLKFGDQLYLGPNEMPSLRGLKVLRPGLHLGTIKKNRFEPSHALALVMKPEDARVTVDRAMDSLEVKQYLSGQTLLAEDDSRKGWCLVCVEGLSIGWGKLASGIVKNHYPKGLRKYL